MAARFLLDANILSEPLRQRPNATVLDHLRRMSSVLATAAPVWNELLFGCYRLPDSHKRRAIEKYLLQVVRPGVTILPYDERAAAWHGTERARLAGLGKTPAFVDGQIAAIAAVNGLVLVTSNVRDFAAFDGLVVEDWRATKHGGRS